MAKALLATAAVLAVLQDGRTLERFRAARPSEADLAFYRNDWAPSLDEAKARGAKEGRPVFLVAVGNLNGYDSLYTGHC